MYILAIESTQSHNSVALFQGDECKGVIMDQERGRHVELMVAHIEQLLAKCGIGYKDLSYVALSVGPGSFAGVRIGITCAKAIALVHSTALIGVSNFEAALVSVSGASERIGVALDARRGQYYHQIFSADKEALSSPSLDEALPKNEGVEWFSPYEFPGEEHINLSGTIDAKAVAKAALFKIRNGYTELDVTPLYIRPPDAKPQKSLVESQ
jgi:tRNA threonylcarbamoyladenosine biosynthesis protein TsaB